MKLTKKIIIILITVLILFMCLNNTSETATLYNNNLAGYTINNGNGSNVTISANKEDITFYDKVLKEPNVFCAEHGQTIVSGRKYDAGKEYTVQDPVLAYILAKGNVRDDVFYDETQVALWRWLYKNYSSTDANNISGNKDTKQNVTYMDTNAYKGEGKRNCKFYLRGCSW